MSIVLGIDTGGTYTDAVLLDNSSKAILSKAKALTTHQQLELGIRRSIENVLKASDLLPQSIELVSVSTTLATNAVVEGTSRRICAVMIGMQQSKLISGLMDNLADDEVLQLEGGHDGQGNIKQPVDLEPLESYLKTNPIVSGFAICSYFSVRNPEHELAARSLIQQYTNTSITCSHELASALDAPKRLLTTVLNARLIGLLDEFTRAIETSLKESQISAPLMIVKGDGSLITAHEAKHKAIETIYSGPAASLVGACYLVGLNDAIISDIGGTTTDIAILKNGQPKLNPEGVRIGHWRTMVKAVDMHTFGLGGDSEIKLTFDGLDARLELGPRRILPLSLLAKDHPELVHKSLDQQLSSSIWQEHFGYFVIPLSQDSSELNDNEKVILESISSVLPLEKAIVKRRDKIAINKLVSLKRIALSGLTPTDAAHVLGIHSKWDKEAAQKGLRLFAKQKDKRGQIISEEIQHLAGWIYRRVSEESANLLLETSLKHDGFEEGLSQHPILQKALSRHDNLVSLSLGLSYPVVGLGASAHIYYPEVGKRLGTQALIPEHAEVANAVGAVVGLVRNDLKILVTQPEKHVFRVHFPDSTEDFGDLNDALETAKTSGLNLAIAQAKHNGAAEVETKLDITEKRPLINGEEIFLEASVTVSAYGRPGI